MHRARSGKCLSWDIRVQYICKRDSLLRKEIGSGLIAFYQGDTKRCRLSWLTNSALVYEPKCGWWRRITGFYPMSTAVHMEPK
jgi:hypothetical protein